MCVDMRQHHAIVARAVQRASGHLHTDGSRVLTHVLPQSCCLLPAFRRELSIHMVHA